MYCIKCGKELENSNYDCECCNNMNRLDTADSIAEPKSKGSALSIISLVLS